MEACCFVSGVAHPSLLSEAADDPTGCWEGFICGASSLSLSLLLVRKERTMGRQWDSRLGTTHEE